MPGPWSIRMYKKGEEKQLNDLFCLVFQRQCSLPQWRWKFLENPAIAHLTNPLMPVVDRDGEIIGQFPLLPIRLKYQDNVFLVVESVDSIVHPAFRELQLLIDLVNFADKAAEQGGAALKFGFTSNPTYLSNPAYLVGKRLLRYKDLCLLPTLFRRLNWRLALQKRFPWLPTFCSRSVQSLSKGGYHAFLACQAPYGQQRIVVREVPSFDCRIDSLWEKAQKRYTIMVIRDEQFLNWRYVRRPDDPHTILVAEQGNDILGYVVLKVKRERDATIGFVVDFLTLGESVDALLLKAALRYFLSQRVDYVLCRVLREDPVWATLRRYGFWERPEFPPAPVLYRIFSAQVDKEIVGEPQHWHLTYGDELDFTY